MSGIDLGAEKFMLRAVELAAQARPSPNPQVGAVVVADGRIVAEGYHRAPGLPHAEVEALTAAGELARGADLYVTLEPCCHQGRTGPCTAAIAQAGISRVFVGMTDPDPRVNGQGIAALRAQGITVVPEVAHRACADLLWAYAHHRRTGMAAVTIKAAATADGRIAAADGSSRWITGKDARTAAHALRAAHDAVSVGAATAIADNPALTVRHTTGPQPIRIVADPQLRAAPYDLQLWRTAPDIPTWVCCGPQAPEARRKLLRDRGVTVIPCPLDADGGIDVTAFRRVLAQRGVLSLLVEGGGRWIGAFVKAEAAQRLRLFVAPRVLGNGPAWYTSETLQTISDAIDLHRPTWRPMGADILLEADFPWD